MTRLLYAKPARSFFRSEAWRSTERLGAAYLACYLAINCVLWGLVGFDPIASFLGKLVLLSFCAVAITVMSALLYGLHNQSFSPRALTCLAMAAVATPLFCVVDHLIYFAFVGPENFKLDPVGAVRRTLTCLHLGRLNC